jgi:hypothetical protein
MRSSLGVVFIFLLAAVAYVTATPDTNRWGWVYNRGAPISPISERRINIVAQMLINGGNAVAAAAFVKVVPTI